MLCLARNPEVVRRLADEKEAIFEELQRGRKTVALPGALKLLQTLRTHDVRFFVPRGSVLSQWIRQTAEASLPCRSPWQLQAQPEGIVSQRGSCGQGSHHM